MPLKCKGEKLLSKEIVFFDIDGTLLNDEKEMCQTTFAAIKQLQKNGTYVALATGRPPFMFKQLRKKLNIDTFISYTGSYIECENEVIFTNTMDEHKVKKLHQDAIASNDPIMLMGTENMQVTVANHPDVQEIMNRLQFDYPQIDVAVPIEPIYQILLFKDIDELYKQSFPQFRFLQWSPIASDVLPATSSKSIGIKRVIDKLGIDIENTYAFGDGLNDLDMITSVGTGIAMGNAVEEVKNAADYVTDTVDEFGVRNGLLEVGLI